MKVIKMKMIATLTAAIAATIFSFSPAVACEVQCPSGYYPGSAMVINGAQVKFCILAEMLQSKELFSPRAEEVTINKPHVILKMPRPAPVEEEWDCGGRGDHHHNPRVINMPHPAPVEEEWDSVNNPRVINMPHPAPVEEEWDSED